MRRIFTYVLAGLAIIAGFCLAFTIIFVLVAHDNDGVHELSERWVPYISLILVVGIPAVLVWAIFRIMRNFFVKKIRHDDFERQNESEDKMS